MKDDVTRFIAVLLFILAASLLAGFISKLDFSNTGLAGFIGGGDYENGPAVVVPVSYSKDICSLNAVSNPPSTPVFFVEGLNSYTNHLRLFTARDYVRGEWIEEETEYGEKGSGTPVTRYKVTPIVPFERHIPVARDTFFVTANASYSKETSTYLVDKIDSAYVAFSSASYVEESRVGKATSDSRYLSITCEGAKEIKKLAEEITKGAKNDYEKAKMIEEYLKSNYEYGFESYGNEPLYEFLFIKKKGICKHFASAFVMMCRSVGIPARMVFGYLAKPVEYNQTVFASQAHAWAEAKFESGWIEFDPTPPARKVKTKTEVTYVDPVVERGKNLTVKGIVASSLNVKPSGYVEIYLKREKNEDGKLAAITPVTNGSFNTSFVVNETGEYHVVAHYVGSLLFESSWSDPIVRIYGKPEISVNLSDRVAAGICSIKGSVVADKQINGTIYLYVDGKEYKQQFNGSFEFKVWLYEGTHKIKLYYPGNEEEFILPASFEKVVKAGRVKVVIDNNTAIAGVWNANATVYFDGEPVEATLVIEGKNFKFTAFGKNIRIHQRVYGKILNLTCHIPEFGYSCPFTLKVKEATSIEAKVVGDSVVAFLRDSRGNPVEGTLYVNGKPVFASNGVVRFKFNESRVEIYFPGDEFHLPSKAVVEKPFPYWLLLLPLPAIAFYAARVLRKEETISFEFQEPDIWLVGDEVEVVVKGKGLLRLKLDGENVGVGNSVVVFKAVVGEGEHALTAERLEGTKVKERKELRFKVLSYRDAVAEVFADLVKDVEKKKGVSLKNATAREVLRMIGFEGEEKKEILSIFEPAEYGEGEGGRKEVVRLFMLCREVKKLVSA